MCTFQGPAISTCATHDTPDVRTGRREGAAPQDLHIGSCSYANLVLGSLMMRPDDAFRRLSARCGLGPISPTDRHLSSNCVLCGARMHEDHIQNCIHTQLYRIMRHDTIGYWLHDHIATRKKWTVIHEQKTWVEHAGANQKPDLFLPDTNQAIDVGIVQPKSVASYYKAKMQAYGARTMPIILGTNGTIHEESRKHLEYLGVDIPKFMAYAIFVIEYQHHKATIDYMARVNSGLKGKMAAATDGRALS